MQTFWSRYCFEVGIFFINPDTTEQLPLILSNQIRKSQHFLQRVKFTLSKWIFSLKETSTCIDVLLAPCMVTEIFRHNDIFFRSGDSCLFFKNWSVSLLFCCFSVMHAFAKKVAFYYIGQNTSLQDIKAHKVVQGQNCIVKYSLFLIVSPWFTLLSLRRPSWRHWHCSPLADGHEGWSLSHWLLVQPRALLLDVQWDNISGAGSLPTVAELGRVDNGDIKGTRTFLLSCWQYQM